MDQSPFLGVRVEEQAHYILLKFLAFEGFFQRFTRRIIRCSRLNARFWITAKNRINEIYYINVGEIKII